MGGTALTLFKSVTRNFFAPMTRKGRISQLDDLTKSLTNNTNMIVQKYEELKKVEEKVELALNNITAETYEKEFKEIDSLNKLTEAERSAFKNSLTNIKNKGIEELTPITQAAQKIKAHMLVTLNKAITQKTILITKSQLATNAHLQLDTIRIAEKETQNVNVELKKLLEELSRLNEDAVIQFSSYQEASKKITDEDDSTGALSHIVNKLSNTSKK